MTQDLITLSSITYAYKAQKFLEQNWIRSSVVRTPSQFSSRGCGYSLSLNQDTDRAVSLLQKAGIRVLRVVKAAEGNS